METPFSFSAVMYAFHKEDLKNCLKHFLCEFRKAMPDKFNSFLVAIGPENAATLQEDGVLFDEGGPELANYMKATSIILECMDCSPAPPVGMVSPFRPVFGHLQGGQGAIQIRCKRVAAPGINPKAPKVSFRLRHFEKAAP